METAMQLLCLQLGNEFPEVKQMAEKLIEKEKEQMMNVWLDCARSFAHDEFDELHEKYIVEEYLNETYYDK